MDKRTEVLNESLFMGITCDMPGCISIVHGNATGKYKFILCIGLPVSKGAN